MSVTYKLERKCKHCGKKIGDKNKSGYCLKCYNKYGMLGENNPFFGKKHKKETIDAMKEKCKIASENKWKDSEYREHVLTSVTGLKRSEQFKKEQSERVKQQMKDPNQRKLRSIAMKKSWENGNIVFTPHISINSSKQEKEFFNILKQYINVKQKHVIKYINNETKRKRHLFPDGYLEDKNLIIEFHGSFWHADKRLYPDEDTIVHHNISAGEIRKNNINRKKLYENLGYNYIEIWSYDFLKDKEKCINETLSTIEKIK